jgi:hypothetical protein
LYSNPPFLKNTLWPGRLNTGWPLGQWSRPQTLQGLVGLNSMQLTRMEIWVPASMVPGQPSSVHCVIIFSFRLVRRGIF